MFLDLLKLVDQVRRAHRSGCRCRECRAAAELIDGGARVFAKLREAPRVEAPREASPAGGQQVANDAPRVVAEVEGESIGDVRRWGREGR